MSVIADEGKENVFLSCSPACFVRCTCIKWEKISVIQWMQLFFPWQLHICDLGGGHPKILLFERLWQRVQKEKRSHLFVQALVSTCTHIDMHTHLCPTLKRFYTPTQQCAGTNIHTWTNAQREQWRVSVLSEWMPFLTLLSKCPCVNSWSDGWKRDTESKTETEMLLMSREQSRRTFLIFTTKHTCLSIHLTVSHTLNIPRPHFLMQQAYGSVAMVTTERPWIVLSIKKSGGLINHRSKSIYKLSVLPRRSTQSVVSASAPKTAL